MVLLLPETGMKSTELFRLTAADVDVSDPYSPELRIKHAGKATKKDRKVRLPGTFVGANDACRGSYPVEDALFPFTDRFGQALFVELRRRTGRRRTTPRHCAVPMSCAPTDAVRTRTRCSIRSGWRRTHARRQMSCPPAWPRGRYRWPWI
jgi:hypothetical protein